MEAFAIRFLMAISSFLGVQPLPTVLSNGWTISHSWQPYEYGYQATLNSDTLLAECATQPDAHFVFPSVVHSAHRLFVDGKLAFSEGDTAFKKVRSFYGVPELACKDLPAGKILTWQIYSYSRYFARLQFLPYLQKEPSRGNLFYESLNAIAGGTLLVLGLFFLIIFYGKVQRPLALSFSLSNFLWSGYFLGSVPGFFGFDLTMLQMHRIADFGVHLGTVLFANSLRHEGLIGSRIFWTYLTSTFIALAILVVGASGDVLQFGTTLPFGFALAFFLVAIARLTRDSIKKRLTRSSLLQLASLGIFVAAIVNDILSITGVTNRVMILSLGVVGGLLFFAVSINEKISEAFRERDYLRTNLETEVQQKTKALTTTLSDLKATEAELIQSAKLASLGTLAAGIAHEINNSLNYVNGSIKPLEKELQKIAKPEDMGKVIKLFTTMKEGLSLTFDIIRSLKNYTGLNQAKFNDVEVQTIVTSVMAILRSRLKEGFDLQVKIEPGLKLFGSIVGLNQIFMNLINNAIDAMPQGGRLLIEAYSEAKGVVVKISDTGSGMSPETLARVFEPFFTTKEVGKGTGLGLHIVKTELERHHATIATQSEPGRGTEFLLKFPGETPFYEKEAA